MEPNPAAGSEVSKTDGVRAVGTQNVAKQTFTGLGTKPSATEKNCWCGQPYQITGLDASLCPEHGWIESPWWRQTQVWESEHKKRTKKRKSK